jgi:hypothetical protein
VLKQTYQNVTGSLERGGKSVPIKGTLSGDQLTFTAGGTQYSAKVSGDTLSGSNLNGTKLGS